ncbi:MAG: glycosyltransferase family 2 protein [Candidatus Latescibacterota bacterium]
MSHSNTNQPRPFVSVIIPMRNEAAYIEQCLDSLIEGDYPKDRYEILVINGDSDDGSDALVRRYEERHAQVVLVDNPKRVIPAALNIGIIRAQGEVIFLVIAHSVLEPDYMSKSVETLEATGADCVGGTIETVGHSFMGRAIALAVSHPFGVGNSRFRFSRKAQYVDTVAFGAYRREVFERIGGFDEELDTNEDYEFNYRLRESGGKIFLNPEIRPRYYSRNTLFGLMKQYFRYGLKKITVVRKHPKAFQFRYRIPPIFILALLITGILGFFRPTFHYLFAAILVGYLVTVFVASLRLFLRHRKGYALLLPVIFVVLHFSFGLGLLYSLGLLCLESIRRRQNSTPIVTGKQG